MKRFTGGELTRIPTFLLGIIYKVLEQTGHDFPDVIRVKDWGENEEDQKIYMVGTEKHSCLQCTSMVVFIPAHLGNGEPAEISITPSPALRVEKTQFMATVEANEETQVMELVVF